MSPDPIVMPHAFKHGLTRDDILHAWRCAYATQVRPQPYPPQHLTIGPDTRGIDIQLVSVWNESEQRWVIIHAMTATARARKELGITRRKWSIWK